MQDISKKEGKDVVEFSVSKTFLGYPPPFIPKLDESVKSLNVPLYKMSLASLYHKSCFNLDKLVGKGLRCYIDDLSIALLIHGIAYRLNEMGLA